MVGADSARQILQRDADVSRLGRQEPNGDAGAALLSAQAARCLLRDLINGTPDRSAATAVYWSTTAHNRAQLAISAAQLSRHA